MQPVYNDEGHIAVNTAIKRKIRLLWVDPVISAVVHPYLHLIYCRKIIRDIPTESGIAAIMTAQDPAVQLHLRGGVHTLKLQIDPFIRIYLWSVKTPGIYAGSAPIIVASVLTVKCVPGMRNVDSTGFFVRTGEAPALVYVDDPSHSIPPKTEQAPTEAAGARSLMFTSQLWRSS